MSPSPDPQEKSSQHAFRRLAFVLGLIVLTEVGGCAALALVSSRVYTEDAATYADELRFGDSQEEVASSPATTIVPYPVTVDLSGRPADLSMRYYPTAGRICQITGDVALRSADGKCLWTHEFEGFSEDLGPSIFAFVFVDVDGDGLCEVLYRHLETEYEFDPTDCDAWVNRRLMPMQMARLDGRASGEWPSDLRARCITAAMSLWLAFPLLGFLAGLGLTAVFLTPPIAFAGILAALWAQRCSKANAPGDRQPLTAQVDS